MILDVFSRYPVDWMAGTGEAAVLAKRIIEETCLKRKIRHEQLAIHADRGRSMKSRLVALLLSSLGAKKRTGNRIQATTAHFKAQFMTLMPRLCFPERFEAPEDARTFCRELFP